MHQVSIDEARAQLPDLVEAAVKGEEIFIVAEGERMVQLVPVATAIRRARFGSARGLVTVSDDFDAPLPDFGCGNYRADPSFLHPSTTVE